MQLYAFIGKICKYVLKALYHLIPSLLYFFRNLIRELSWHLANQSLTLRLYSDQRVLTSQSTFENTATIRTSYSTR